MASNVSQRTVPYYWCSANDDVIYEFDFNELLMNGIGSNGSYAQIVLFALFDVTPQVGEYVYVNSNVYVGTYKILSVDAANIITIDTPYIGVIALDTYNCYHLRIPTFSFYKGFKGGEAYEVELPYTKVADIKPSVLYDSNGLPYISINVKGLTKSMFTIVANTVANSVDFSVFNAIRLEWDGLSTISDVFGLDYTGVLNCAITNEALQLRYINSGVTGGFYLTPVDKPLINTVGVSFASLFVVQGNYVVVEKYVNGIVQW